MASASSSPVNSTKSKASNGITGNDDSAGEIAQIKSAFPGKCRIVDGSGDYTHVVTIQPGNLDATIKFQLRVNYPSVIPDIAVRSSSLTSGQILELRTSLTEYAKKLTGTPMIYKIMEHARGNLSAMGLKPGKVKKVESDVIIDEKSATRRRTTRKKKKPKSEDEVEEEKKKPMKTAEDVIKRILWDESLDKDDFLVGYIDRFRGLLEKYFSAFTWEDLATVDYDVLAVPQHRIQYFKYKTVKVWDKPLRIDNVFGSAKGTKTIDTVIAEYEKRQTKEEANEEEEAEVSSDYSDEDSDDDEDDLVVTIGASVNIGVKSEPQVESEGENDSEVEDSYNPYWRDKLRPNYFVCVRVTDPSIIDNVIQVQDYLMEQEPLLGECCIPAVSLHVTLCTVGLDTSEQLVNCMDTLKKMKDELKSALPKSILKFDGVSNFYNRVIYAKVQYEDDFVDFCNVLKLNLLEAGIEIRDGYEFVPHITIMKTTRPVSRQRGSKNIDPATYKPFLDKNFGEQKIDSIHLCSMSNQRRGDGFYITPVELAFN